MTALIWSPFGDLSSARAAARVLVEEKLVGCANIVGGVTSVFEWKGEVTEETEVGVLFKTDARLLDGAIKRLEQLHPYETPAIVGWIADQTCDATSQWLGNLVGAKDAGDRSP